MLILIIENLRNKSLDIVGRLKFVHPTNNTERYALRSLLLYRKGITSYSDMKTVNGVIHKTYKETLISLGFASDDKEYYTAMREAIACETDIHKIRELFAMIIMHCELSDPVKMWNEFKANLSEDILYQARIKLKNQNLESNEEFSNLALHYINLILNKNGKNLEDYGFISLPIVQNQIFKNSALINEELSYDIEKLKNQLDTDVKMLNEDQAKIYDLILNAIRLNKTKIGNNMFFIDGPGGEFNLLNAVYFHFDLFYQLKIF